jgi:hypothetical protein
MDSSWYAVDKNGHVALFITGAGGAVPNNAFSPEGAEELEDLDPETLEELGLTDTTPTDIDAGELPARKHLFVYQTGEMDECLADRYERTQVPKKPLHVDQLAPQVRQAINGVRFETLDFSQTKVFQPVELTECATWDPAYLSGDGKTVRPVPGREGEYPEFYEEYGQEFGDGVTVEGPPE